MVIKISSAPHFPIYKLSKRAEIVVADTTMKCCQKAYQTPSPAFIPSIKMDCLRLGMETWLPHSGSVSTNSSLLDWIPL